MVERPNCITLPECQQTPHPLLDFFPDPVVDLEPIMIGDPQNPNQTT